MFALTIALSVLLTVLPANLTQDPMPTPVPTPAGGSCYPGIFLDSLPKENDTICITNLHVLRKAHPVLLAS